MEAGIAKVEAGVEYLQREVGGLKSDVRELRADMRDLRGEVRDTRELTLRLFRLTRGGLMATTLGLAGLRARGFHWL